MSVDKSNKPIQLHEVLPPTAEQAAQAEVIDLLERVLVCARNGEVSEIVMILLSPNGEWRDLATHTETFTPWIGKLEVLKANWIRLMQDDEEDG